MVEEWADCVEEKFVVIWRGDDDFYLGVIKCELFSESKLVLDSDFDFYLRVIKCELFSESELRVDGDLV